MKAIVTATLFAAALAVAGVASAAVLTVGPHTYTTGGWGPTFIINGNSCPGFAPRPYRDQSGIDLAITWGGTLTDVPGGQPPAQHLQADLTADVSGIYVDTNRRSYEVSGSFHDTTLHFGVFNDELFFDGLGKVKFKGSHGNHFFADANLRIVSSPGEFDFYIGDIHTCHIN